MTEDQLPGTRPGRPHRALRVLLSPFAVIILVIVVVAGGAGGAFALRSDGTPDETSVEAGFLRDMITHHSQAVEMTLITYRRSMDPEIVLLSYDIATTQQSQVGMMIATLDLWDLSQTGSEPAMSWMGSPMTGLMPGMATPEQVEQLSTLPPEQADILLLQLMIAHHRAGIDMANALLERSGNDDVRHLADVISRTQMAEVTNMNAMLVARGQAPVDGAAASSMGGMDGTESNPATTPDAMEMDVIGATPDATPASMGTERLTVRNDPDR